MMQRMTALTCLAALAAMQPVAVHGSCRIDWIDFDKADGTPEFDGCELSVGWKF